MCSLKNLESNRMAGQVETKQLPKVQWMSEPQIFLTVQHQCSIDVHAHPSVRHLGHQVLIHHRWHLKESFLPYPADLREQGMGILGMLQHLATKNIIKFLVLKGHLLPIHLQKLLPTEYLKMPRTMGVALPVFVDDHLGPWIRVVSSTHVQNIGPFGEFDFFPVGRVANLHIICYR